MSLEPQEFTQDPSTRIPDRLAGSESHSIRPQSRLERIVLATGLILAVFIWGVLLCLHPDPSGFNTHRQLGLPPCPKLAQTGWPCLTCGFTTAFAHAAHGHVLRAFGCQPFGGFLFTAGLLIAGWFGYSLITHIPVTPQIAKLFPWKWLFVYYGLLILLVGSWFYTARQPIRIWLQSPHLSNILQP